MKGTSTGVDWDGVVRYAEKNPRHEGGSWNGWCQAFCYDSGGFTTGSFQSARLAGLDAKARGNLVSPSAIAREDVPVGWLAFWTYPPDGHVFWVAPNGRYLGASSAVTSPIGVSTGYVSMASYDSLGHGRPDGYSPLMRNEHLAGLSSDGNGSSSGGGTSGGGTSGGGTTGGGSSTVVLTSDDKSWIQSTVDKSITNKIDDIVAGIWAHSVASAVDGSQHLIQTYMAWAQRDAAAVKGAIDSATPARILAKESSSAEIWALNPQQGTKRHVTPGQWTVLSACGIKFQTVTDGTLAAFNTVL